MTSGGSSGATSSTGGKAKDEPSLVVPVAGGAGFSSVKLTTTDGHLEAVRFLATIIGSIWAVLNTFIPALHMKANPNVVTAISALNTIERMLGASKSPKNDATVSSVIKIPVVRERQKLSLETPTSPNITEIKVVTSRTVSSIFFVVNCSLSLFLFLSVSDIPEERATIKLTKFIRRIAMRAYLTVTNPHDFEESMICFFLFPCSSIKNDDDCLPCHE